jgi:hypothetical protein
LAAFIFSKIRKTGAKNIEAGKEIIPEVNAEMTKYHED